MIRKPAKRKTTKRITKKVSKRARNPESTLKDSMLKYLRKKQKVFRNDETFEIYGLTIVEDLIRKVEAIKNWSYSSKPPHEYADPRVDELLHEISTKSTIYSDLDRISFFDGDDE